MENTGNIFVLFQTNVSSRFVTRIGDKLRFRDTFLSFFFFFYRGLQYLKNRENTSLSSFVKIMIGNNFTFIRNYETFMIILYIYSKIIFNLNLSLIKYLTYLHRISLCF